MHGTFKGRVGPRIVSSLGATPPELTPLQIGNSFNYQQRTEPNVTIQSLGGANDNLCYTLYTHVYMQVELLLDPSCSLGMLK